MRGATPFWVHQAVEYLVGLLLIVVAMQSTRPALPALAGVGVVVLAATADGPLGLAKWVPRRVHRVLDLVVMAGLVVAAIVVSAADGAGRLTVWVAAAVFALMLWRTNYRPKAAKTRAVADDASVSKGETFGRAAGRALGKGITSFRDPPKS
jgi:F0F1-type ATP synthase assembly protein I